MGEVSMRIRAMIWFLIGYVVAGPLLWLAVRLIFE